MIRANARLGSACASRVWRTRPRDRELFSKAMYDCYAGENLFRSDAAATDAKQRPGFPINTRDTRSTQTLSLTPRRIADSVIGSSDGMKLRALLDYDQKHEHENMTHLHIMMRQFVS